MDYNNNITVPSKNSKRPVFIKRCAKCQGQVYEDKDEFGQFTKCLQCGFEENIKVESRPLTKQELGF